MSYGKMNRHIDIITTEPVKDDEGFVTVIDTVLASVRAYKEERRGTERWANMAAFSEASAMFRFRSIPSLTVDTSLFIADESGRYRIVSAEDVRGRGMYVEVFAEKIEAAVR